MSKKRSRSGPCRVVGTVPKITLSPEQQAAVGSSKRAILASKDADHQTYEEHLRQTGKLVSYGRRREAKRRL